MVEPIIDTDGSIDLQPVYDDFKDFEVGMLVTCIKLIEVPDWLTIKPPFNKYRKLDYYGIITDKPFGNWFNVNYQDVGIDVEAVFHRDELGWGYQPSYDWRIHRNILHDWLSK